MKVLFATDGSPNAMQAADYLMQLRFGEPLDVILVTVSYDPRSANPNIIQPWFPEWIDQETQRVESNHAKLEDLFASRCASLTKIRRDGHVATMILDEAKQSDVDLIVLGARGHALIERLLLGSVSDNIATHADCSVLVVRPHDEIESPFDKILFAFDGSNPSRDAISEIIDLDWNNDTELTLVSVAPIYDFVLGDGLTAAIIESQQEILDAMRDTAKALSVELATQLPHVHSAVEQSSHVGDAIVEFAKKAKSDLVVVGDAGHILLHDVFLGSTTKYVLRHAPCSVWISRHHRKPPADLSDPSGSLAGTSDGVSGD